MNLHYGNYYYDNSSKDILCYLDYDSGLYWFRSCYNDRLIGYTEDEIENLQRF